MASALHPHVVAAHAFLARTDDLADQGPLHERLPRRHAWAEQVSAALESGSADDPVLRAFRRPLAVLLRERRHLRSRDRAVLDG